MILPSNKTLPGLESHHPVQIKPRQSEMSLAGLDFMANMRIMLSIKFCPILSQNTGYTVMIQPMDTTIATTA
jgi:hypothetical protein